MTTDQTRKLLDRDAIDQFVRRNLMPTITLLRELVDYGVGVLARCSQVRGNPSDLVIVGHFFKHSVCMLDAAEILLSRGAVLAAGVPARSLLEAYIYLEWDLRQDTETRARQFYVWHLRQKRIWARRTIPGTDEHNDFKDHMNDLSEMKDPTLLRVLEQEARRQDAEITKILTNANNKAINDGFERRKKRQHDVAWYRPCGPSSISDMATRLGLEREYDFIYSSFSDITHAAAFDRHIKFDGEAVVFEPIRSPDSIDTVARVVSTLAFRIYPLILKKYIPAEEQPFNESYVKRWRTRFLSIPNVVVSKKKEGTP